MTEEEAKTKWCPFIRCDGKNQHWGSDRSAAPISACCGSKCMAWRSVVRNPQRRWRVEWRGETTTYFWDPSTHAEYADAKVEEMKPDVEPRGFCGLAGRPE